MDDSLERWAKSLVGRDWEIFWTDDSGGNQGKPRSEEPECMEEVENLEMQQLGDAARTEQEVDEEEEEEADEEDWYEGRIQEIESVRDDGSYSFRVRFVGDDTIYTMVLDPSIVRASARAWIKRSKALLGSNSQPSKKPLVEWEKSLPPDTRTLEDEEHLGRLESQHAALDSDAQQEASSSPNSPTSDESAKGMPCTAEFNQVQRLSSLLSAQLYLRSKLAPIVEHTGGPSEAYVDHLLECLKCLDEACQWYIKCWMLHQKIFPDPTPSRESASERLDEDYAIREGLQEGRRVITHLLRVDTSLAGSKRRRPAETSPGGTRKTKRRRRNKSLLDFIKESERGSKTPRPEEDEFLASDAVINFVDQVQCNDNRWYTRHFAKMMQSVSLNIVAPLLLWRYKVEAMLGDRPEAEGEADQTDGETSDEDSEEEGDETTGSSQSEQRFYSFDEIKSFEEAGNSDPILQHFDLSRLQGRLGVKLSDIQDFEKSCWSAISQVFSSPVGEVIPKENDAVYSDLERVQASAAAETSSLNNVSPLGSASSVLCRKVIDDALTLRGWYLDLHRLESSRERLVFIDKMAARASELPRLPQHEHSAALDGLFDQAVTRLRNISQGYFDHLTRFNKYRSILLSRSDLNDEGVDFTTIEGVADALQNLGEIQVLSIAEEMLSVRLDVLRWKSTAESLLAKPKIRFDELVALKNGLDEIQRGCSEARNQILLSIETNENVNAEIRAFAEADVTAFCGSTVSLVNSKHALSCTWKERADSIACAIKQHSGQQTSVQKPLPMVDLKRVSQLMRDYDESGIFLPDDLSFLHNVYEEASKWSQELTTFILDDGIPLLDLLSRLQSSKLDRPKGIIVDPARHVVDNLVDVLAWRKQTIETMKETMGMQVEGNENVKSSTPRGVYTLVAEGSEILEVYATKTGASDFTVNSVVAQNYMYKQLDSRRPMRVISRTKLESNFLGSSLLERIFRLDAEEGSPIAYLLCVLWQASVADFIEKYYESKKGTKDALTLESAQSLASKKPKPAGCSHGEGKEENWGLSPTRQEDTLMQLISAGVSYEEEAARLLTTSKELFKGVSRQVDAIQTFFGSVKELQNRFKAPLAPRGSGLALSRPVEQQLDQLCKVLTWLVRTFPYPFLYQAGCDLATEKRIPWDVLVSLNERKPGGIENMGDCAGIALRVAEIFDAANSWQTEISTVTMLSFRGAKRRGEEAEGGAQQTVDVEQVRRLVRDPVLRKVAMPRESAVSEILESAKNFETHLHNFLGTDFDGNRADIWQDRAPYPDTRSLLGRSGEFLLYRLTGSPLYTSLTSSIENISSIAQDVLADTPGKVAFEWIRQAVAWIDSIRAAVSRHSYTVGAGVERLVIAESDARAILHNAKSFFLDLPDDLKRTLSAHRIFLSTNKLAEKLKVVFKKGGAHHSVGGTAIKWCPILFDSLKEDISRLDAWKEQVQKLRLGYQEFSHGNNGSFSKSERDVVALTGFHEELVMLLEEGVESLVIAPSKDVLDTMNDLQKELQTHLRSILDEHSAIVLNERVAKRRFEEHELLIKDRFNLLDALLARSSVEFENSDPSDNPLPVCVAKLSHDDFRDCSRASLEDALQSAALMMGLQQEDDPTMAAATHYSMRAGEIEHELHNRYHNPTEYKEKANTLTWIFGDYINPKLCLQVLLGEADAAALVSMKDKELIGDWKALPEPQSTDDAIVAGPSVDEQGGGLVRVDSTDSDHDLEMKVASEASESSPPEDSSLPGNQPEQAPEPVEPSDDANMDDLYGGLATSIRPEAPPSLAANVNTAGTTANRPSAPPSLAASLVASGGGSKRSHSSKGASGGKTSRRGKYLMNSSGDDNYLLAVSKPFIKFKARFHPETDQGGLNGALPENLTERGRLRIEEFQKFLSGKLKGGKWTAVLLRLSISESEDAKKHKKFYKEYESMKRIAMFSVSENLKLFLVTPRFHRVAAKTLGSSFSVDTSTYAIALTRVS